MKSISLLPGLAFLLLASPPAMGVIPVPAVELAPPEVVIEWAWIAPGPDGKGEQLVPAAPGAAAKPAADPAAGPASPDQPPQRLGTVRFRYQGARPTDELRITVVLPAGLDYVPGSATGPGAETEYLEPERRLRWSLAGPIEPGTAGLVSFRARVSAPDEPEETP